MEKGYTHVYTGNGKGKTTAMLGLALRAAGAGFKVYIGQFVKCVDCSELRAIEKFLPSVTIEQYGMGFIRNNPAQDDIDKAKIGFDKACKAVFSDLYDMVMLDEINIAVKYKLISVEDVLRLIKTKPAGMELVLTGRGADREIIEAADLVSEIMEIKHYYSLGVSARVGIEK